MLPGSGMKVTATAPPANVFSMELLDPGSAMATSSLVRMKFSSVHSGTSVLRSANASADHCPALLGWFIGIGGLPTRFPRRTRGKPLGSLLIRSVSCSVPLTDTLAEGLSGAGPPTYGDPRYEGLERALLALPADLREVIRLRRFEGLSSQEVAGRTGRSDDAVRKMFSRAMAKLTLLLRERP